MDPQKELMNARVMGIGVGMIIAGNVQYVCVHYIKTRAQFCGLWLLVGLLIYFYAVHG
jgi:hypothetical protein